MKIFQIAFVFAVLALNLVKADIKKDVEALHKVCTQQAKTTSDEVAKFFGGGMKADDATPAIKCHIMCIMEQNGHIKDGVFDDQHVLESFKGIPALKDQQEAIAKAVAGCKTQKGNDNCDTAYKLFACFHGTEAGKLALSSY